MEDPKTKKTTKRNKVKYPALHPHLNLKIRYEELADIDYVNQLNDEEKKWLNDFLEAEVNANPASPFFTAADKKRLYRKNNDRNRCVMSRAKARNQLSYFSSMKNKDARIDYIEDAIIFGIDNNKKKPKK